MTILKIASVFCFSLFLFSCDYKHTNDDLEKLYLKKFPRYDYLKQGKSIDLEIFTKMAFFLPFQEYLIIHDIYSGDRGIYILNKETLELIQQTGKIGKGPGEIGRYGTIFTDVKKNRFYVADFGKNKIWKYSLDSIVADPSYFPQEQFSFRIMPGMWPLDFIVRNDSLYFLSNLDYFMAKVHNKDSIEFVGKYKDEIIGYNNKEISKVNNARITVDEDQLKYAFAFMYADVVTITGDNFNPDIINYGKGKSSSGKDVFKDICYYVLLKSDDKYLYAGYMNKPMLQFDSKYGNHKTNYPQTIRIFNWAGKPIVELKCNDPFSDFYIDRDNNRVILYLTNKKTPIHVYDVDFKELLK